MRILPKNSRIRSFDALSVCSLLVAMLVVLCPAWGHADDEEQYEKEEAIFGQAQKDLMAYMTKSVDTIGMGHELAYKGFESWYVNDLLPAQDDAPGIEKVFRYLVEELFLAGVATIIPNKGVFVVDVLHGFSTDAYGELAASMAGVSSQQGFLQTLELQLAKYRTKILDLPIEFETGHPDEFEGVMFQYLDEELEAPGIHEASDYGLGDETRAMLDFQGFPEPSTESAYELAERLLIAMVFEAKVNYDDKGLNEVWGTEHYQIDANVTARRILYPDHPDYYCKGSGMLGMLRPKDCY